MKGLKIFFWTSIFWLVVVAVIFGYAKYVKSGQWLANTIAKMVGVTPASEMLVDEALMNTQTDMNEELEAIQAQLANIESDVQLLVGEMMMSDTKDTVNTTDDVQDDAQTQTGDVATNDEDADKEEVKQEEEDTESEEDKKKDE